MPLGGSALIRVIFLGMTGNFSIPPLKKLIEMEVDLAAVIIPAAAPATGLPPRRLAPPRPARSDVPVLEPYLAPNILHLAWSRQIPVWEVSSLSEPQTLALLAALQPDLIVVACFTLIFPLPLLQLPPFGCLNLHPSPLPAYRGPAPIFWMARQGEPQAGVTLHFIDEGLDSGDIVAQTTFAWPDGILGSELEQRCAASGAQLLAAAVQRLAAGQALPRQPQPEAGRSYFPWPAPPDLTIPRHWTARRAFNFMRAAAGWPLVIEIGSEHFPVRAASGYEPDRSLGRAYLFCDDELWVQFEPGVLKVRL